MINQNELRLGNYVLKRDFSVISTSNWAIEKLDTILFAEFLGEQSYLIELEPIPLTEEILEACGFELNSIKVVSDVKDVQLIHWCEICKREDGSYGLNIVIKAGEHRMETKWIYYLHELQNLYFILFNQELELKSFSSTVPTP